MLSPRMAAALMGAALSSGVAFLAGCTNSLNRAIYREKPELVQKFLKEGADVNQTNDHKGTPLIYAAQYGDLPLIQTLVERGAHVNAVDDTGNSPLCYLAIGPAYRNDCVEFLLAHGAEVNVANDEGCTPLHLAALRSVAPANSDKQAQLFALLLKAGANTAAMNAKGEIPLHCAASAGQPDTVLATLLAATKDPHALDASGCDALSAAAAADQRGSAAFLAAHGFAPQALKRTAPQDGVQFPKLDRVPMIIARSNEVVADTQVQANPTVALASYRASLEGYDTAVTECQKLVDYYDASLKAAKEGRQNRWFSTIALNVLGAGVGAATGVGFVVVPKKVKNNFIDEYSDGLAEHKKLLESLSAERAQVKAKVAALPPVPPPAAPEKIASAAAVPPRADTSASANR